MRRKLTTNECGGSIRGVFNWMASMAMVNQPEMLLGEPFDIGFSQDSEVPSATHAFMPPDYSFFIKDACVSHFDSGSVVTWMTLKSVRLGQLAANVPSFRVVELEERIVRQHLIGAFAFFLPFTRGVAPMGKMLSMVARRLTRKMTP
jgi:hypothetical protein